MTSYKRFLQQLKRERLFRKGDREGDVLFIGANDGDDLPLYVVPFPVSEAEWLARVEREQRERTKYPVARDLADEMRWPSGSERLERPKAEAPAPQAEDDVPPIGGVWLRKPDLPKRARSWTFK